MTLLGLLRCWADSIVPLPHPHTLLPHPFPFYQASGSWDTNLDALKGLTWGEEPERWSDCNYMLISKIPGQTAKLN